VEDYFKATRQQVTTLHSYSPWHSFPFFFVVFFLIQLFNTLHFLSYFTSLFLQVLLIFWPCLLFSISVFSLPSFLHPFLLYILARLPNHHSQSTVILSSQFTLFSFLFILSSLFFLSFPQVFKLDDITSSQRAAVYSQRRAFLSSSDEGTKWSN
jgi:hypothetical protein